MSIADINLLFTFKIIALEVNHLSNHFIYYENIFNLTTYNVLIIEGMIILKRILRYLGLVIFLLVIISFFAIYHISHQAFPDYNETVSIKGLHKPVKVLRDSFAIPHIYAENEEDLYRITGYLMAQDRLWQMDLLRRVTTGRLSEIFGKKMLKTDMLMRSLRIPEKSLRTIARSDPKIIAVMNAFADGVNQYITQKTHKLPIEFQILRYKPEMWKVEHSFNLMGYIAWDLNGSWNSEILLHKIMAKLPAETYDDFIPKQDSLHYLIYKNQEINFSAADWRSELMSVSSSLESLGLQIFHGSNNWVISGSRTASGKPMLANDMHLGFSAPGIWYQMHQVIKDRLDVTGVILPGEPFIVSGHNNDIAWGMTNVMNDDIDFYKETLNGADSSQYKLNGSWKDLIVRHETIAIKGGDTANVTLRFTHRGPVISMLKNLHHEVVSMRWMGNEKSDEVRSVYLLNRAHDWIDFRDALKTFVSISQNVGYADKAGNIGMYCCAGIPVRKGNPVEVFPGDTTAYDWEGIVPFDLLPHVYNPKEGYAISANNQTADTSFHHYISKWFDLPYRYDRINNLLKSEQKITPAQIASIQTDYISELVLTYLPTLIGILKNRNNPSTNEKLALNELENWKGMMNANSTAAAIFEVFYNRFIFNLIHDELGDTLYNEFLNDKIILRRTVDNVWKKKQSILCDNVNTPSEIESFATIVNSSFTETLQFLEQKMGPETEQWKWGKIHTLTLEHPLGTVPLLNGIFHFNRGPYNVSGSFHTIAPFSYRYADIFKVASGASQRNIYDTNDWDNSLSVIPTGNCGIPGSKHYCDQTELYLNGKYHPDQYSIAKIASDFLYKAVFVPAQ